MKTLFPSGKETEQSRRWFIVNADGKTVGRLASKIARVLRGKNNPKCTPGMDTGDFVVVINASKVRFSGQKWQKKEYNYHTGYIGHLKTKTAGKIFERKPEEILKTAVRGMLPKNPLGRKQLGKLKIYKGDKHPHAAQKPIDLN